MYLATLLKGQVRPVAETELATLLNTYDWIVAEPEAGGPGTVKEQFAANHNLVDLDVTRQVIQELSPEVLPAFDEIMGRHVTSFYNMFYTSREELVAYCEWLFKVLFEVERRTDISSYSAYQQRLYGFLAERLLNV